MLVNRLVFLSIWKRNAKANKSFGICWQKLNQCIHIISNDMQRPTNHHLLEEREGGRRREGGW